MRSPLSIGIVGDRDDRITAHRAIAGAVPPLLRAFVRAAHDAAAPPR